VTTAGFLPLLILIIAPLNAKDAKIKQRSEPHFFWFEEESTPQAQP